MERGRPERGQVVKRTERVLEDLLVCENTVGRLPPRLRLLWLLLSLALVALLGVLGWAVGRPS